MVNLKITVSVYVIFTLCIAFSGFTQVAHADSTRYSKDLVAIEQNLMDAITYGRVAVWEKYLDKQFFIVTEDGSRLSRQALIASIKPLPKGFSGSITVIDPKLSFSENTVVISYVADEHESVYGQNLHTYYSTIDTYIKKPSGWKIIASQIFEIPHLPPAIKVPVAVLNKYAGTYRETDTITCEVSLVNDTLYIQKKGRAKEALLPETENVFFRKSDTRGRKIFVIGDDGTMLMRERRNGEDVVWKRVK